VKGFEMKERTNFVFFLTHDDYCFNYFSWRNHVKKDTITALGTLSSFLKSERNMWNTLQQERSTFFFLFARLSLRSTKKNAVLPEILRHFVVLAKRVGRIDYSIEARRANFSVFISGLTGFIRRFGSLASLEKNATFFLYFFRISESSCAALFY